MTPKDAFDNIIKRAENKLVLHGDLARGLTLSGGLSPAERESLEADVLRASLVIAVSALDRYVHDRVTKGIIAAYKAKLLNREQEAFALPVSVAIAVARKAAEAKNTQKQVRAANLIRNELQKLLHERSFQGWREIEIAFKLIGISGIAGTIQGHLGLADISAMKADLAEITRMRNLIVHEGSLNRHKRGGNPVESPIDTSFVSRAISIMKQLVDGLEQAT